MEPTAKTIIDPSELTLEAAQWMEPIRERWHQIYGRFKAETQTLIDEHGGSDFVQIKANGRDRPYFHRLVLWMDQTGRLRTNGRTAEQDATLGPPLAD